MLLFFRQNTVYKNFKYPKTGFHVIHIYGRRSFRRSSSFPHSRPGGLSTDTERIRSDEGLTLEISALKLSMVANLRYQFS